MPPPHELEQDLPGPLPLIPAGPGRGPAERTRRVRRPLPDARAIAKVEVPELAPPYDDAPASPPYDDVSGNRPAPPTSGGTGQPDPARPAAPTSDRRSARTEPIPGVGPWPSQFAQVLAETLAGARSAEQLAPWTTQQARRRISQLGPMLAHGPQPRVRRIILTSPVAGVLEMAAIIAVGSRVHAVAVRLERPAPAGSALLSGQDFGDLPGSPHRPARPPLSGSRSRPGSPAVSAPPAALTAAPTSRRAVRLRATARWICTAVEVA
jgi:Family of unknown function (DUF6459)